jgi:Ca2+-transporting ATPase
MSVEVQKETAPKEKWFMMTPEDVAAKLSTSLKSGLTSEEAKLRLEKYGYNELKQKEKDPWWKRFLAEFNDFLVYILIVAALLSAIVEYIESSQHGEPTFGYDWIVIAVIVILNAIIGFVQEGKADAALEALKKMSAPEAQVIRDGKEISIKAREIVIGDIIVLHEGDMVPADGRIFEESNLKAEEAALTGESVPVTKRVSVISDPETPLAEMKNMVFSSTLVTFGRGQAIVTSTGMNTEVGKIATMIDEAEEKMTPLQESLEEFGGSLGKLILVICGVVALIYIIRSGDILGSILAGVALAVAAIPEGLPAVVTICLAIGVTSMAKKNAIVKKLHSVETLGCTTVICSDKTGTLTKNEMTVRGIWAGGKLYSVTGSGYEPEGKILLDQQPVDVKSIPDLEMTLRTGLLCNNARLSKEDKWKCFGDPTEGCLITSAWKAGLEREATYAKYPRINEIPFDSGRKRMTTINKTNGKEIAYVKGATEILLDFCKNIQWEGKIRPITDADKKEILKVNEEQASKALRGLGFAYRDATGIPAEIDTMEKDLTFVGMQFMIDPPRDEVKEAIKRCKSAGIDVKMITGDNLMTAVAIAEELDMAKRGDPAYQGKDIPTLSDDQINAAHVFARVSPEHKQNIVKALQNKNHIVAMTGDGVNDAPALKNANVGVAMGITGTEVSKEAAVMILADDNFATIVNAVEEGRGIYDNIKKFIQYLLSSNIMEVLVLLIAAIIGLPLPLLPIQLLWINLVTDGAPAIALGYDPYDPTLMQRKPRPVDEPILTKSFITTMIYRGIIMTVVVLGLFYLYDQVPPFMVTSFSQIDDAHLKLAIAYGLKPGQETEFFAAYNQLTPEQLAANYTAFLPGGIYENEILANGFEAYTEAHARSVCFLVMMFGEMANAFNCRSEFNSIFKIGLFTNKIMLYSVGISSLLTIALYIPGEWVGGINYLGRTFYVLYLEEEWLWVIPSIAIVIGSVELIKIYFRKIFNLKYD